MKNLLMRALIWPGYMAWRLTGRRGILNGWAALIGPLILKIDEAT